jgi:rhomboid family GlyGly-CTERM serine protease
VNDSTNRSFTPRRRWLTPSVELDGPWTLLLLSVIAIIALAATGDAGRAALRYQRDALLDAHQYWRLLTGHLVHGSWQHTWLNLAGVAVIVGLFRGTYSATQWCWIALASIACIDLGLLLLMPQLQWYVGLSGLLHGLLAAGTVAWWRVEARPLAAALSAILVGKLIWEQWQGALPLSGDLNVIVNAHLYGAVGGLIAGVVLVKRMPLPSR